MLAFRGSVALQKIKISQKFSGFEKLLLVGGITCFRTAMKLKLIESHNNRLLMVIPENCGLKGK
jgi:hypothetical protein